MILRNLLVLNTVNRYWIRLLRSACEQYALTAGCSIKICSYYVNTLKETYSIRLLFMPFIQYVYFCYSKLLKLWSFYDYFIMIVLPRYSFFSYFIVKYYCSIVDSITSSTSGFHTMFFFLQSASYFEPTKTSRRGLIWHLSSSVSSKYPVY